MLISDYFDKQEGSWWQPVLSLAKPRMVEVIDGLMARLPTDIDRVIISEYYSSTITQRQVSEAHEVTYYKVSKLTQGFMRQVDAAVRLI